MFVCHMPKLKQKKTLITRHKTKIVNKQLQLYVTQNFYSKKKRNILEIIMLKKNTLESFYQQIKNLLWFFFHDCQNVTTTTSYTHDHTTHQNLKNIHTKDWYTMHSQNMLLNKKDKRKFLSTILLLLLKHKNVPCN